MNDAVEDRFLDSAGPTLCQCCGTDGLGFEAGETRRTRDDLESQIQIQLLSEEDPIRTRQFKVQTKDVVSVGSLRAARFELGAPGWSWV